MHVLSFRSIGGGLRPLPLRPGAAGTGHGRPALGCGGGWGKGAFQNTGRHPSTPAFLRGAPLRHAPPAVCRTVDRAWAWGQAAWGKGPGGFRAWTSAAVATEAAEAAYPAPVQEGLVTRRQSVGAHLTFMDIETAGEGVLHLKVHAKLPRRVKPGARIRARGEWREDERGGTDGSYLVVEREELAGEDPQEGGLEAFGGITVLAPAPLPVPGGAPRPQLVKMTSICKTWLGYGDCGDPLCRKRHDATDEELERAARGKRKALKKSASDLASNEDPDDPHRGDKMMKHVSDRVFAEWMIETWGRRPLLERGVADIAGGRGELSFELHVEHAIPCTLLDPRRVFLTSRQWTRWKNLRRRGSRAEPGSDAFRLWQRVEQWLQVIEEEDEWGSSDVHEGDGWGAGARVPREKRSNVVAPTRGLGDAEGGGEPPFRHLPGEFWARPEDLPSVDGVHALVGMHSDQATEPIVDAALALGKPFAVVPCCVFPTMFPDRVHPDGGTVTTYDRFVEYLAAKDPSIEVGFLRFQGRNKVVYRR